MISRGVVAWKLALLAALLAVCGGLRAAPLARRAALIIGNARYGQGPLPNCRNDAADMGSAFRKLDFAVTERVDVGRRKFRELVQEFARNCDPETLAVFYYSGHGVHLNGRDYLIPVDADIRTQADVDTEAIDLEWLLGELEKAKPGTTLLILDACRDNPLPVPVKGDNKGLLPVRARPGVLVAFAASPGQTASANDAGRDSLYTQELLKNLAVPGLRIEDVLIRTRNRVLMLSHGEQAPREDALLTAPVVLRPGQVPAEATVVATQGAVQVVTDPPGARITLDGRPIDRVTPATVPVELGIARSRMVLVGARLAGYEAEEHDLTVERGRTATLRLRLRSLPTSADAAAPQAGAVRKNPKDQQEAAWIPPGELEMGVNREELEELWKRFGWPPQFIPMFRQDFPRHRVTVTRGFWLGRAPVTLGQYRQFCNETKRPQPPLPAWSRLDDQPIVMVYWDDATAYCRWAGGRLPTEAEWELAARAGETGVDGKPRRVFLWGNERPDANARVGNLADISFRRNAFYDPEFSRKNQSRPRIFEQYDDGYPETAPVGSFPPNGYGLWDMAGNVLQWCADPWDESFYAHAPQKDPAGGDSSDSRVVRGSSFATLPDATRISVRMGIPITGRFDDLGFRVAFDHLDASKQ